MSNKDYKKLILDCLLKKYNNRHARHIITNRRIILKPEEIYKDYTKNNADLLKKQGINDAVSALKDLGFVNADYLKFSDDIEKIYLLEEHLELIYKYLRDEYGVIPQSAISKQIHKTVEKYICTGEIARKYCESILSQIEEPGCMLSSEKVEANLKMFRFLEHNMESLYIREASMLVYGDSKWFENNNYEEVCTFIRTATGRIRETGERNDAVLGLYNVTLTEQEIYIKGKWKIEWEQYVLDVSKFQGGIAITSGDVCSIKSISVCSECIMTIENKTSFQRMKDKDVAMMYLGGFANRYQIDFLPIVSSPFS